MINKWDKQTKHCAVRSKFCCLFSICLYISMQWARALRSGRISGRPRANWLGDGQGWQMGNWGPFLLHRQETEARSVSRQTQGTSCFCTRRRTISESHCRSIISAMLSNVKEASRRHQRSSCQWDSELHFCVCFCECVTMFRVSCTWLSLSLVAFLSFTQTMGQICGTCPLQHRWQCVQCDWTSSV